MQIYFNAVLNIKMKMYQLMNLMFNWSFYIIFLLFFIYYFKIIIFVSIRCEYNDYKSI